MVFRRWIEDIRTKTKGMSGSGRAEYIAEYYWYHILLAFLGVGLVILLLYHVTLGRRTVSFACVIVNGETDYERDRGLAKELAQALGLQEKEVRVDSDYHVSYAGHEEMGKNESDYEKFFFGWSMGELDAVILPENFLDYCRELEGEFRTIDEGGTAAGTGAIAVPLSQTNLSKWVKENAGDPMMVVFPANGKNEKEAGEFLRYIR